MPHFQVEIKVISFKLFLFLFKYTMYFTEKAIKLVFLLVKMNNDVLLTHFVNALGNSAGRKLVR
jgi:hypothetical protein